MFQNLSHWSPRVTNAFIYVFRIRDGACPVELHRRACGTWAASSPSPGGKEGGREVLARSCGSVRRTVENRTTCPMFPPWCANLFLCTLTCHTLTCRVLLPTWRLPLFHLSGDIFQPSTIEFPGMEGTLFLASCSTNHPGVSRSCWLCAPGGNLDHALALD